MEEVSTYTVKIKVPNNITLHYNNQDVTVNGLKVKRYILKDVTKEKMSKLLKLGIVLSVTTNRGTKQ